GCVLPAFYCEPWQPGVPSHENATYGRPYGGHVFTPSSRPAARLFLALRSKRRPLSAHAPGKAAIPGVTGPRVACSCAFASVRFKETVMRCTNRCGTAMLLFVFTWLAGCGTTPATRSDTAQQVRI